MYCIHPLNQVNKQTAISNTGLTHRVIGQLVSCQLKEPASPSIGLTIKVQAASSVSLELWSLECHV